MRNIILFLSIILFSSLLYADGDINKEYKRAVLYYKSKNFLKSYEILSKLYLSKLSDSKLSFYLGRSAYETGHYEVALSAFERVEMLDSGNLRNRLEMARTYFMLKMYEESELAFKEVLQNPNIPKNVRTNIELYLSKVTKVQQKSFTYANINIDWIYDSNVNYGSLDSEYNINTGTLPSTPVLSDRALQVYGDITNIYDIGDKNGFAIKNRFVGFIKDYTNQNLYDVKYISYTPSILYSLTKHLIEFSVGVDDLVIAKSNYLTTAYVIPKYEYAHTTTLRSIAYFKYQRKHFERVLDYDLNSNHYELSYALQKILSPRSYIQGDMIAIYEKKLHGIRNDVNYAEYRANIAYAKQFTSAYGADIFAEYRRRDYSDYSTLFASTRADNSGTISATLNAKILQTLRFHVRGIYSRVESNQDRYSYQKYTITLGVNKTF